MFEVCLVAVQKILEMQFTEALVAAGAPHDTQPIIHVSSRPSFGDYQCNAIMAVAKQLKTAPRIFASQVVEHLNIDHIADKVEVAGPGFINIFIKTSWLAQCLENAIDDNRCGVSKVSKPQTVVIDYSAPNVAKEMHVGHLRSTIIGDASARIHEFMGHKVIRQNHLGDWGTQFGMLISQLEDIEQEQQETTNIQLNDLETFYRSAKVRFDQDHKFADKSRLYVVQLQSGNERHLQLWKKLVDITLERNQDIYDRLNVSLTKDDIMGESAYNNSLPNIIKTLKQKKLLTLNDKAKVVFLEDFKNKDGEPMGVIVQKSDGGYLYTTTDLAAIRHRCHTLNADKILYYVDARQAQHFEQVFSIAKKAGFATQHTQLSHHTIGLMLGNDNKPFKTRSGNTIKLSDLLDEAEIRAARLLATKSLNIDEVQKVQVIKAIAIGSIKYADLSKNRSSSYVFNWDNMLAFDGNTLPYLLYAYTRIQSILKKSNVKREDIQGKIIIKDTIEKMIALQLNRFDDTLNSVVEEGTPSTLCTYLYDLAGCFMQFYETCPINKDHVSTTTRDSRLKICTLTGTILKQGLNLLGINTIEQM